MKKTISIIFLLTAALLMVAAEGAKESAVAAPDAEPAAVGETTSSTLVYAKVPSDWAWPSVWAWDDSGASAFPSWPGEMMVKDEKNEGWWYLYLPSSFTNVIINANDGTVQTSDYSTEGKNTWFTVSSGSSVTRSRAKMTQGDLPEDIEWHKVYAQVSESWTEPGVWAWEGESGKNAFSSWPGSAMKKTSNGWYVAKVPVWCDAVIVNANGGTVQTGDMRDLDPSDMWITVDEEGKSEITYEDPTIPKVAPVTVYASVPSGWDSPCLWAWSHPDGTNAFVSWPGEAFSSFDGWYEVSAPGWINSVIVNANGGTVQTADLRVDSGKDIWVVVDESGEAVFYYEKP
ncbi:MAG: starch-binding protein [Candidatus Ornithospirochaeta sp.]